ncbi:hypothetical protein [uncultured Pedobacter sp.]|uniref:hypothetical protein n=1 Tax=uncultured Pedobacter sp. TaxID=246139 RepID=UPI00261BBBEC|nr:hypothetical protein [uncultured Pedobacter sp.]
MSRLFSETERLPQVRKLRGYAFDPGLSIQMDTSVINDIVYKVNWESLSKGPVGEYLEVVDYDPTLDCFYRPVDLNEVNIVACDGLSPSESNPQFHQQMVYAVAMTTIANFEKGLGRKILVSLVRSRQAPLPKKPCFHSENEAFCIYSLLFSYIINVNNVHFCMVFC